MKKIWITSLAHEETQVQKIMAVLKTYALDANSHFWMDDLKKKAEANGGLTGTNK